MSTSILLPLHFKQITSLEKQHVSYIEQAILEAIRQDQSLIISVTCDEIKAHVDCLDAIWQRLQAFLGNIYVVQLQFTYTLNKPLFECNVVFSDLCGYNVHLEPYIQTICIPEDHLHDKHTTNFILKNDYKPTQKVPTLLTHNKSSNGPIEPSVFQRIAVGGTFDHIHAGHKILLTMTAILAKQSMVVGVTDDCMLLKKKHKELIASTTERIQHVKTYLELVKRSTDDFKYEVVPIKDPFGPTVTDPTIDALVVSKETLKGGDLVNNERDMRGYPPLELRIIDVISSENASIGEQDMNILKISSSWIREYIATKQS
ncbi:uncharacterized protein BX663DRAFT_503134 [Cokeromyces recurvatus]|uniref:uncharacterized protein n=1 Tax=Cokeromyces recurvatus TaxID=90255 RepID=UPI00221F67FB|nr:uncharacterized protein BX663DRAFT_503134 [Cokeromyces recurvatus]KAI7904669.1 hypothetical protein BX663DRAFT_503134 [Cokeromyces recurvatus]